MTAFAAGSRPPALAGELRRSRLANGLELVVLVNPQAPIVASALFYRVGTRDEPAGLGGAAHFLEHLMFKGSARYGPGEIDRRTQALGGVNNAFTSHDVTAYWFTFAADRWAEALAIEADRMRGLRFDPREVDAERRVVIEEIAMYRDEPWEALELDVQAELFRGHAYGRPVLGTAEELTAATPERLRAFHELYYRPANAILVLAGDVGDDAEARVAAAFGDLDGGGTGRAAVTTPAAPAGLLRVERRHGEVARLLLALPAPPPDAREHAHLRLLATLLAAGRASRLQRVLVEEGQLCLSASAGLTELVAAATFTVEAELLPGAAVETVEGRILEQLAALAAEAPAAEVESARRIFLADWAYGQERIYQQAVVAGLALAQFDLEQPERLLAGALAATPAELAATARRWLDPHAGSVLGRSLPEAERRR